MGWMDGANPFRTNAKSTGPQFGDPGKRNPNEGLRQDNNNNDGQRSQPGDFGNNGDGRFRESMTIPGEADNNNNNQNTQDSNNSGPGLKKQKGNNPMLDFSTLWEDKQPTAEEIAANKSKEFKGYIPDIDPKAFNERLSKHSFTKNANPELLKKVAAGGEEGMAAMMELVDQVGRDSFAMAMNGSSKMIKHGFSTAEGRFMQDLIPGMLEDHNLQNTLRASNKLASNPKFAPVLKIITQRFKEQYPKASAEEITSAVSAYMDELDTDQTALKKQNQKTPTNIDKLRKGDDGADWFDWAMSDQNSQTQE